MARPPVLQDLVLITNETGLVTMTTKSQHTVPRLHLQHFTGGNPKGQIWTYDVTTNRRWSQAPLETGTQTHFYSVQRQDGTQDTRIEEMLSGFESRAAPVYEGLLNGDIPKLNTQERIHFAEFMGIVYARTSAMRKINAEIQSRALQAKSFAYANNKPMFERMIAALETQRGETIDPVLKEEVRQGMLDPSKYEIEIPKHMTLEAISLADQVSPILYNMKWSLAHPRDGFFISSDNPLVRSVDPRSYRRGLGDGGFKNKTAEVTLPLSNQVILLTSWDQDAREYGSFDSDDVQKINELRAVHADRFLYAHVSENWIAEMGEKYKDSGIKIDSFGFGPSKHARTTVGRK